MPENAYQISLMSDAELLEAYQVIHAEEEQLREKERYRKYLEEEYRRREETAQRLIEEEDRLFAEEQRRAD